MELVLVGGLLLVALAFLGAVFTVLAFLVRGLVWLILLPFKLIFGLIVGIVVLPVVATLSIAALVIGAVVLGALVIVPLLPLLLVAALVWLLVKMAAPAVV